jgi:hypothetical protein
MTDLESLISRAGGPVAAARLLGVPYRSSFARWRRGEAQIPDYILASIRAHLALSDRAFARL